MGPRAGLTYDSSAPAFEPGAEDPHNWWTFGDMRPWHLLGARCAACNRRGTLNRYELERRWGSSVMIMSLSRRLRCTACSNRANNRFWFAMMKR